jgi:hypothetical protein
MKFDSYIEFYFIYYYYYILDCGLVGYDTVSSGK